MTIKSDHGNLHASEAEPEFDTERVIWDADYRRGVIERLRQWHQRNNGGISSMALSNNAA
ncbi:MAG: hypothetical protein OEQ29_20915 [Alphaproteobacteria bacterium]|nr:hypothetical protein [Alphaproteobacteria bacterium]